MSHRTRAFFSGARDARATTPGAAPQCHVGFAGIESPSVKREIAINASALEVRVALLEDNELAEFYLERNRQVGLAGNIYKGKVTRVLPGMQAAFVDIGLEKAGFLHVSDFHDGVSALNTVAEVLGEEDVETEPIGDNEFADAEPSAADEAAATDNGDGIARAAFARTASRSRPAQPGAAALAAADRAAAAARPGHHRADRQGADGHQGRAADVVDFAAGTPSGLHADQQSHRSVAANRERRGARAAARGRRRAAGRRRAGLSCAPRARASAGAKSSATSRF